MKKFLVQSVEILPGDRVSHLDHSMWTYQGVETFAGQEVVKMSMSRDSGPDETGVFFASDFNGSIIEVED